MLLASSVTFVIKNHNFPWLKHEHTALSSEQLVWWMNWGQDVSGLRGWNQVNCCKLSCSLIGCRGAPVDFIKQTQAQLRSLYFVFIATSSWDASTEPDQVSVRFWGAEMELKGRWWDEIRRCPESRGVNEVLEQWSDIGVGHFSPFPPIHKLFDNLFHFVPLGVAD